MGVCGPGLSFINTWTEEIFKQSHKPVKAPRVSRLATTSPNTPLPSASHPSSVVCLSDQDPSSTQVSFPLLPFHPISIYPRPTIFPVRDPSSGLDVRTVLSSPPGPQHLEGSRMHRSQAPPVQQPRSLSTWWPTCLLGGTAIHPHESPGTPQGTPAPSPSTATRIPHLSGDLEFWHITRSRVAQHFRGCRFVF